MPRRSSFTPPTPYSLPTPVSNPQSDTTTPLWSRQPSPLSYYQQSSPLPQQYQYAPQSQQQRFVSNYLHPSAAASTTSDYPPPYATSTSYTSTGNNISRDDNDSPYIQQTTEQSLVKMGKIIDHCNQIAQFASQYRDMRINHNPWNGIILQVNESHLTNMINRAFDVLNVLSGLKSEVTSRFSVEVIL